MKNNKTYIIAEIGINANGSLATALEMITEAHLAGADAVKFQKRNPEVCVPEHKKGDMRDTPWGRMTYIEYKHKIEFGKREYDAIDEHCKNLGIDWSASCWDLDSLEFIEKYDVAFHKIASASITDLELLKQIRKTGKKIIMSTGMSTKDEISAAVKEFYGYKDFTLLHCVSSYPLDPNEASLGTMKALREEYNRPVGWSDHAPGLQVSLAAVAMGATVIERHFTLDRTMWGTDQAASLEPKGLKQLVRDIRIIENAMQDLGLGRVTQTEEKMKAKLRREQ
jgi:N-acetylneuraminate synthase